jgi:hypothetical protein
MRKSNVTVSGNAATTGGGLATLGALPDEPVGRVSPRGPDGGTVTLTNVTVSGSSATTGGGLATTATMALTNTIVSGNAGGGDVSGAVTGANNLIGGAPSPSWRP